MKFKTTTMKHKFEDFLYFMTLWFSASVIVLFALVTFVKLLKHLS